MVDLRWLEPETAAANGATWGVPWPTGALTSTDRLRLADDAGTDVPLDSWISARWPDGSAKWTGHSIGAQPRAASRYSLTIAPPAAAAGHALTVTESDRQIAIDTGALCCVINRSGEEFVASLERNGRGVARNGRLVSIMQSAPVDSDAASIDRTAFFGAIDDAVVERSGAAAAVVKITGRHRASDGSRRWLPFIVRLYFYASSHAVRTVHTFIWDGDEQQDFLAGLGIRFDVPFADPPHDRHVRISGADHGFLVEAVRGLTGLRRDPGAAVRTAQVAGIPTPPISNPEVANRMQLIPTWGDYTLAQLSSDGFTLRKRTKQGHGWIDISTGTRSTGFGYVGSPSGGLGLALRDFWQSYPTQIDIRSAASAEAQLTVWLYSPQAPPMDLRFYHDGFDQHDYPAQLEGLEITYEDYEPGFGTPYGVARTHELTIWTYEATPPTEQLAADSAQSQCPPILAATAEYLHSAGVFGDWSPVDRSTPKRSAVQDELDYLFDFYVGQREQRRWYGFWNYGDIMHSYDADRHVWKYDVGGFAWDNSELSPDLWLWYSYLRSGRADVFRFAEAMTRHTGEVDVYHAGRRKGLGSRHNVQHWGCSAKQHRISNAAYRRIYYYLTADERTGDLLTELVDSERSFVRLDPSRKVRTDSYSPDPAALAIGLGTDWGALAAAWLTDWERTGNAAARDKLLGTMVDIGTLHNGFLTGEALYDLNKGRFDTSRVQLQVSHLSAVFGLVEICSELIDLAERAALDIGNFTGAWLQYCRLFLATPQVQTAEVGRPLSGISLIQGHSRLTAYAAHRLGDAALAEAAWTAFESGRREFRTNRIDGPAMLASADEAVMVSTNGAAQFGLAAIQNLALIPDALD